MRRIEALKTKEPAPANQISQTNSQLQTANTVKPWTMCLKSVIFFKPNKYCPNTWMRPTQSPIIISMLEKSPKFFVRLIPAGEITQIFHVAKITMTTHGQTVSTTSNLLIINTILLTNTIFPAKFHTLPTKVLQLKRNLTWRRLCNPSCKIWDNWWAI